MARALTAEFIGTFWLVFGGCGAAIFAGKEIGNFGIAMAFGLTVLTMAFALGRVSGGHFNPAVTIGMAVAGRISWARVVPYIIIQVLGGIGAAAVLYIVVVSSFGTEAIGRFAANGYGELSPGQFQLLSAFVVEAVLTCGFLLVIIGSTDSRSASKLAPLAIGLSLTLIHLISIPVTNTSVNPARSLSQALFAGPEYMGQLWLFWVAPITGAILAGIIYCLAFKKD